MSDQKGFEFLSSRRQFVAGVLAGVGSLWATDLLAAGTPDSEGLPAGATALSETDPMAVQLGYKADAAKADATKYKQLKTAAGKAQNCKNCMFYTVENGGWGKCQLFAGKVVNAKGWCATWAKKA